VPAETRKGFECVVDFDKAVVLEAEDRHRHGSLPKRLGPLFFCGNALLLGALVVGDLVDDGNEACRLLVRLVPQKRTGNLHPDDNSILAYVALLEIGVMQFPGKELRKQVEIGGEIVRMCDLLPIGGKQFVSAIARDFAEALIYLDPLTLEAD